ncbi:electron transport complex subunit RsxG [Marinospirillum perlucidum]|uniref:electron transport complex subunit RsxG n=1 Tax=Marinospirillum perlucidum TaxID=1982602 RepID=UPI000DF4BE7C|nr:electron transport complex subunit RsxG [Marinospirillum perlucidum]
MSETSLQDRLGYQSLFLGVVVFVTCALLAFAYQMTREPIRLALENDLLNNFSQVLPAEIYDNNLLETKTDIQAPWGEFSWYQASLNDEVTGVVFPLTAYGYAGDIEMLIAVRSNGEISGVRVLVHRETPGLGDKIEVSRDPWITEFNGLSLQDPPPSDWGVKKDGGVFDQFTGATITPRAVVAAIKRGLEFFEAEKATFLTPVALSEE